MSFAVDKAIFENFPELTIGLVVFRGIDNSKHDNDISQLIQTEEARIREEFKPEILADHPRIKSWREAYASFVLSPVKIRVL